MKPKKSQNDLIVEYLKPFGRSLTWLDALKRFNCRALNSRISDLRGRGIRFGSKFIEDKRTGKRYKKYWMI